MELNPKFVAAHDNLLYTLTFHPASDPQSLYAQVRQWNRQFAEPLKQFIQPHLNDRNPDRRLRIGYVSPDFYNQAESFFVVPLLESHDHQQFEIHGYASVSRPDAITDRLRHSVDLWHNVLGQTDEQVATQIRNDRIDILIDLTMHMAHNRLLVFARKPAPVQVTWLAYPGSTGLTTIDYRITDRYMDPPDSDLSCYSEQSISLPDCWVCYDPLTDVSPVALRPQPWRGPICFGSLNNPCKMNDPLLRLWAAILKAVPDSRILLLAFADSYRQRIRHLFEGSGVDPQRLDFVGRCSRPDYLRLYDRIDICLDPLPYNGITTTCDALWMGVPVISLAGKTAAGRAGVGMLTTLGLSDLTAASEEQYIQIATSLANDLPRLAELRSTLRQRMQASPLMDTQRYARGIEAAYRTMWRNWCGV